MPSYLVETYLSRSRVSERAAHDERARAAAEGLTRERRRVRFTQSFYVREDELCFYVFDAPSADVARLAARRAGIDPLRVVRADSSGKENRES